VSLSGFLMNVLSAQTPRAQAAVRGSDGRDDRSPAAASGDSELQRYKAYRKLFGMAEVALPAQILGDREVAGWAREHHVVVDVHTGADVASVAAASIPLSRVTVFADGLSESDLRAVASMGVGQIVAGSVQQLEVLRSVVVKRRQDVVLRMTDAGTPLPGLAVGVPSGFRFDSNESDAAVAAVIDHDRLDLVGLHCEVGAGADDFVSYPAAIGQMIAEMTQIRRNHGVLLTRLGLGGGRVIPPVTWVSELRRLATEIDESLDDACGTLRFPRPLVVLSASVAIGGQSAA
jgi:diaminopimelate decarboxylase